MVSKLVIPEIASRFSPRNFRNQSVSDEDLHTIFDAAKQAPSSFNEQPWRFLYAKKTNEKLYDQFLSCLTNSNQKWAKSAPVLVMISAKMTFYHNNKDNRHAYYDTGQAMGILLTQLTSMGLSMRQMAGFYQDKAQKIAKLPENHEIIAMAAIGYPPANLKQPERVRNAVEQFVKNGVWSDD
jgi:nitroreductase